jgi:hypothetical protein
LVGDGMAGLSRFLCDLHRDLGHGSTQGRSQQATEDCPPLGVGAVHQRAGRRPDYTSSGHARIGMGLWYRQ